MIPAAAAPILGEAQDAATTAASPGQPVQPAVVDTDAAVIEITIEPSLSDPDMLETTVVVSQQGGRQICVDHTDQDIIVRSYETDNDPFDPPLSSQIEGQDSGHVGELSGFNSENLFITPTSPDDLFNLPEEPFTVGEFQGVLRPEDLLCDQQLTQGDFVCVAEVIRSGNCALIDHAGLLRALRIMLALNGLPTIEPAAGPQFGRDTGPVFDAAAVGTPGGGLPSGRVGAAPGFSGSFSGSGGGDLVPVPNVVGLPLGNAISVITSVGFAVGTISAAEDGNANLLDGFLVGSAFAQVGLPEGLTIASRVVGTVPPAGFLAALGSPVNITAQEDDVAVPEPSTLSIFLFGLLLAVGVYILSRGRHRRFLKRAEGLR